jgi:hypothetical protein
MKEVEMLHAPINITTKWNNLSKNAIKIEDYNLDSLWQSREKYIKVYSKQPSTIFICRKDWVSFVSNPTYRNLYDPVNRQSDLKVGYAGILLGLEVYTDSFIDPPKSILDSNYVA